MTFLAETNTWEAGIYQLETTDPVEGGAAGKDNVAPRQLANRTVYLKGLVDGLASGKQPIDATLTALAGVILAADRLIYATAADTFSTTVLTALMRTLLGSATDAAARSTLGAAATVSPAFTGTPTAPTPATGTNTAQLATTAFVQSTVGAISTDYESILGNIKMNGPAALGTLNTSARGDHVHPIDTSRAPLASPSFTGVPIAPTPAPGTNTTQLSTTAFVQAAIATLVASSPAALNTLNELATALGDDPNFATTITNALALKAALASPAFTGSPTAPTPAQFDNDLSLATTAFVQRAIGNFSHSSTRSGSDVLTANDAGKLCIFGAAAPATLTLPPKADVSPGACFTFSNTGVATLTVAANGVETIDRGGSSVAAIDVPPCTSLQVVYNSGSTAWMVMSAPVVNVDSSQFAASAAPSGYMKHPSGVTVQWGVVSITGATPVAVTLPISFVNNYSAFAMRSSSTAQGAAQIACSASISNTQITIAPEATATGTKQYFWQAIGLL